MRRWTSHYCTLFDSGYLTRGLAMLESLHRHDPGARVAVFCFDDHAFDQLRALGWEFVVPLTVRDLEQNPKLAAARAGRTVREFCWTSTSFTILHCLEKLGFPSCTYLDADMFFFSDPRSVFAEHPGASVLITEHRYAPAFDNSALYGKYCVQFVGVQGDEAGLRVIRWWTDACAEWCFDRAEDGKFGDQKYLDGWTTRFPGVQEVTHEGAGVAPWNVQRYSIRAGAAPGSPPLVARDGREWPVIFYHFHGLKLLERDFVDLSDYPLPRRSMLLYGPYLEALRRWEDHLHARSGFRSPRAARISPRRFLSRLVKGRLNHRRF